MTHKEALAVEELAEALGWSCESVESVEYEFAIQLDREVFDHYDAAMAYLQALGVRDD